MIDAEACAKELVVRGDHVVIVVLREVSVQLVAGLRRFPMADAVRKNDEVSRGVQELARPK